MAYTPIPDYVTNQQITAAHGNTYWKNNFAALFPYAAIGDIAYASAVDTLARLGLGTAGQVLKVNSGATAPEWGDGKGLLCYGYLSGSIGSANQTSYTDITNATVDLIVPDTAVLFAVAACTVSMNGYTGTTYLRWVLDGTNQTDISVGFSSTSGGQLFGSNVLLGLKSSVPAGTRTCKLQYYVTSGDVAAIGVYGFILGFAE